MNKLFTVKISSFIPIIITFCTQMLEHVCVLSDCLLLWLHKWITFTISQKFSCPAFHILHFSPGFKKNWCWTLWENDPGFWESEVEETTPWCSPMRTRAVPCPRLSLSARPPHQLVVGAALHTDLRNPLSTLSMKPKLFWPTQISNSMRRHEVILTTQLP